MINKKFFITISNDHRFLNNQNIFDENIDAELSKFKILKRSLLEEGIELTGDCGEKNIDKYIYFNVPYLTPRYWLSILRNKKSSFLFCLEPPFINPFNHIKFFHIFFNKVFVFNLAPKCGKKYFQAHCFQSSININTPMVNFNKRSFLVLINANKLPFILFRLFCLKTKSLYEERIRVIEYFEKNKSPFDLYGKGWNQPKKLNIREMFFGFKKYSCYRGSIKNKNELLSNYKFCICFENAIQPGYITEKIFDCFKARCIPVYWGASDVSSYIPTNCFIDFRKFKNLDDMVRHLESIEEIEYLQYIKNIESFLYSPKTQMEWFEGAFKEKIKFIEKC